MSTSPTSQERVAVFDGPDQLVPAAEFALKHERSIDLVVVHNVGAIALIQASGGQSQRPQSIWADHIKRTLKPTVDEWWQNEEGPERFGTQVADKMLRIPRQGAISWHCDGPVVEGSVDGPLTVSTRVDSYGGRIQRSFKASRVPYSSLDTSGQLLLQKIEDSATAARAGQPEAEVTTADHPSDSAIIMVNHPYPRVHMTEEVSEESIHSDIILVSFLLEGVVES